MVAAIAFLPSQASYWRMELYPLGYRPVDRTGFLLSIVDKTSSAGRHDVESWFYNNCYTLCMELGFRFTAPCLGLYVYTGELEEKIIFIWELLDWLVGFRLYTTPGIWQKPLILVGSYMLDDFRYSGYILENLAPRYFCSKQLIKGTIIRWIPRVVPNGGPGNRLCSAMPETQHCLWVPESVNG